MITEIITEVYETKNDNFAGLVVFMNAEGERVSFEQEYFDEKFDAELYAFNTAFSDLDTKDFAVATYKSNPDRKDYQRIK